MRGTRVIAVAAALLMVLAVSSLPACEAVVYERAAKASEESVGDKLPGEWVFTDMFEGEGYTAVERKTFTFGADGSVFLVESRKGQSSPYLREDWEFRSWGTYKFRGDTVALEITRFAAVRQIFERLKVRDGGTLGWMPPEHGPVFDSVITDGSQNRYFTFSDLREDFRKVR
jgi:hypothetical protein